eukprot:comp22245_c0_seq1/m.32826 comp22245_c0_seq1/g.32826  ORF comp22245_c0_seq1/g.32826 comp22245_c0_seq1/m.32826 type:complete len:788 (-) comp22245_c0_seq1:127-2490(-)
MANKKKQAAKAQAVPAQRPATVETKAEKVMNGSSGSESPVVLPALTTCTACCDDITYYAVGCCNHRVLCHMCSLRMRVLGKSNFCVLCRADMEKVVFTKDKTLPYEELIASGRPFMETLQVYFDDTALLTQVMGVFQFACQICADVFDDLDQLKGHLSKAHEKYLCDLCIANLKIFLGSHHLYTLKELAIHNEFGDPNDTSHRGHPSCQFCHTLFFGNDDLLRHLRDSHFQCHLCENANSWWAEYADLENHFVSEHYLCNNPECRDKKYIVFGTETALRAHVAAEHTKGMSRAQRKAATARILAPELGFIGYTPASEASSSSHSGHGSQAPRHTRGHTFNSVSSGPGAFTTVGRPTSPSSNRNTTSAPRLSVANFPSLSANAASEPHHFSSVAAASRPAANTSRAAPVSSADRTFPGMVRAEAAAKEKVAHRTQPAPQAKTPTPGPSVSSPSQPAPLPSASAPSSSAPTKVNTPAATSNPASAPITGAPSLVTAPTPSLGILPKPPVGLLPTPVAPVTAPTTPPVIPMALPMSVSSALQPPPGLSMAASGVPTTTMPTSPATGMAPNGVHMTTSHNSASFGPPGYVDRNAKLVSDIKEALGGSEERYEAFKAMSRQFRTGEIDASNYYLQFLQLLGPIGAYRVFDDLVTLLPDETKREQLRQVHATNVALVQRQFAAHMQQQMQQQMLAMQQQMRTQQPGQPMPNPMAQYAAMGMQMGPGMPQMAAGTNGFMGGTTIGGPATTPFMCGVCRQPVSYANGPAHLRDHEQRGERATNMPMPVPAMQPTA